jgi:anti-sigma regulatory factor (Ser/Thr protein kinase)
MRANNYLSKPVRYETLVSLLDKYDAIIRRRSARRTVRRMISAQSLSLRVENRVELLSEVADLLVEQAEDILTEDQCYGIRLGLYELLVNAMEHGNLGIGYEEKAAALEEGAERYHRLLEERRADPDRSRRRIHVEFRQTSTRLEWTIVDEGAGFSYQNLPNPLLPPFDQALSGRGIFLARFQFDDVSYHGTGNRVVAIKRLDTGAATPPPTGAD